jgi:hypothetical protein
VTKLLCWLFGHDVMTTSARRRTCVRCGQRETLRDYGHVSGWEVVPLTQPASVK